MTEFYIVEGGIASGKSTFLKQLEGKVVNGKQVFIITEPVAQWCKTVHGNLLKDYTADKATRAFSFQTLAMTTIAEQRKPLTNNPPTGIYLMERSLESAVLIFQKCLEEEGHIAPYESYILKKLYTHLSEDVPGSKGIIYMDTSLDTAVCRLKQRAKEADSSIDKEYLGKLLQFYEEYIKKTSLNVLRITPSQLEHSLPESLVENWMANLFHCST